MSILKKFLAVAVPVVAGAACYKLGRDHEYDLLSQGAFMYEFGKLDSTKDEMKKIQEDMIERGQELWLKDRTGKRFR